MNRRAFLLSAAMASLTGAAAAEGLRPLAPLWQAWRQRFVRPSGRVVDNLAENSSHSEGQAYGMLLALRFDDRAAFDQMLNWTIAHLMVREGDSLMAWQWLPGRADPVPDRNNASDGDLLAAWVLSEAARRFDTPAYRALARAIAQDLMANCLRPCPWRAGRVVLLPGAVGFEGEGRLVQNLSYYVFPALLGVADGLGLADARRLAEDGLDLIDRVGATQLPPDWVALTARGLEPAKDKSSDFGYDAMRVPLNLIWAGRANHPVVARAAQVYAEHLGHNQGFPTRVAAQTGAVIEHSQDPGYGALGSLSLCAAGLMPPSLPVPAFRPAQPYYPASLHMMSLLVQRDVPLGCLT